MVILSIKNPKSTLLAIIESLASLVGTSTDPKLQKQIIVILMKINTLPTRVSIEIMNIVKRKNLTILQNKIMKMFANQREMMVQEVIVRDMVKNNQKQNNLILATLTKIKLLSVKRLKNLLSMNL